MEDKFVIGIDFGTDSVRCLIVNAVNGKQVAMNIQDYPRWKDGLYCNASVNQFRQHPADYIESLEKAVNKALNEVGNSVRKNICAVSIDTTGSTPVAVNEQGVPLALLEEFGNEPDAMFVLWKDHTAIKEMEEINEHAKLYETDYLKYCGGIYSSEWFWSKLLHVLRRNEKVRNACYSWVEHCDWMPFLLTGGKNIHDMKRSVCAAGHKALWSEDWNGLPPDEFFTSLDPLLANYTKRLYGEVYTADKSAGILCKEWAERLGLSTEVLVGVGAIDAHMGAVGGQIEPYYLSKVMGTSTCDMLVAPVEEMEGKFVRGICGLVNGSVIPGMIGMEAGQSAFGDVYAWFRDMLLWPLKNTSINPVLVNGIKDNLLNDLSKSAANIPLDEATESAVDWLNGRRTPDADMLLKGAVYNITLSSDAPRIYRSLVEATCFGSKAIVERFIDCGVPVQGIIGIGGIANKSPFIMQLLADVLDMPIKINNAVQTGALGAAMFAATVAGIYPDVQEAMLSMGQGFDIEYVPDKKLTNIYKKRYRRYKSLGNT